MFEHRKIQGLNDFFLELGKRPEKGVYFYRINGYTEEIKEFVQKYYEMARKAGVILEGKIPNPDEKNLSYYGEIMGMDFQLNLRFISASLKKWLPRMNDFQRESVVSSLYDALNRLQQAGKTENMIKNAYVKFMCWLYYKFERIVNQLGNERIPKILYEGDISNYELMLISILSNAGCDVVLLQYHGDAGYLKLDAGSSLSDCLNLAGMTKFPETFHLRWIREEIQNELNNERLYGKRPELTNCTNAWIEGKGLEDIKKSTAIRGDDPKLFYNCYFRINGVEDKLTYMNELYQFQLELKTSKRQLLIINEQIPQPTMDEIAEIHRKAYTKQDQMLMDLTTNICYTGNLELQRLMIKAFLDVMILEAKLPEMNLNKLTNKAVYLICWLRRYQKQLFVNWKMPEIGCFIYMGGCRNENEALFVKMLAKLPVDILILNPNLNSRCCLTDSFLYEINYENTMAVRVFPQENTEVRIGTAAYHAERELDTLMYQDSGMFRNQQYTKANVVNLQTMYEEIKLLWNEELKYRPNFSIIESTVNIPVIYAKVLGVKDGQLPQYWASIRELVTEDTYVIGQAPFVSSTAPNPMKAFTAEFLKNGKIQISKVKNHNHYPYGFLRDEIQNYMLEKLQLLIDMKLVKGTFENGTEYTIAATILNLPKDILRMIQKFDFTKKNPKLIYMNTGEEMISLEDTILVSFLNLLGFDILFFVPTGYQSIEKFFNKKLMEEHQIGDYMYDLRVPNLNKLPSNTRYSWRDKIFKRGT